MTILKTVLSAAALAVLTVASSAAQQAPPAPGPAKDVVLPQPRTFTLDNGLKVSLVPFGDVPKVDVQLVIRLGNANEKPDQVWLTDLMGDLMREGTKTRTSQQISLEAARMGGSVGVAVGPDEMAVSGTALSESAADVVRLVGDLAMTPSFPESELPRLKTNRLRTLAISKSQPQSLAQERFVATLYPQHPYGRLFPAESQVMSYTLEQIRAYYDANIGANRAHLFVAGRFDAAELERVVRQTFADWRTGAAKALHVPVVAPTTRSIHLLDRPGAVQSSIYVGLPVIDRSHADFIPLQVTNVLLGGAFASRITKNIREHKGYTYSPFSLVSTYYRTGYWAEIADVTTNVTGPSLKEIFAEIDRLRAEPPAAEELRGIQNYMIGSFALQASSRAGMLGLLRTIDLHGLPADYYTNYVRRVNAVTPADVQRMARTYLDPQKMIVVVVGDRNAIAEQLKPFGTILP